MGAGQSYSADGIVNASNYTAGPFAPNSIISIYGKGLARSTHALGPEDLVSCDGGRCLPLEMNFVRVLVQYEPAPMLFVSDGQINFLMPTNLSPGPVTVQVLSANEVSGVSYGPEVMVALVDSAPALFSMAGGYAIATNAAGGLLTADSPAHANDTVVIYLTGLGMTSRKSVPGAIPASADPILPATRSNLRVMLNGSAVDPQLIKYVGVTPGCGGLYQINMVLPDGTGPDPEIRVSVGNLPAQTGLKLPLR